MRVHDAVHVCVKLVDGVSSINVSVASWGQAPHLHSYICLLIYIILATNSHGQFLEGMWYSKTMKTKNLIDMN